jgi:hypothetical protein
MRWTVAIIVLGAPLAAACGSTSGGPSASPDDASAADADVDASGVCTAPAPMCFGCCGSPEQAFCAGGSWECPQLAGLCLCGDGSVGVPVDSLCQAGLYTGPFGGMSELSAIGASVAVAGDVQLSLAQEGTAKQTCSLQGLSYECSDLFSVHDGVIRGTAGALYPFSCTLTGTLSCKKRTLISGSLDCTYCVGPLDDGGMACAPASSDGGTDASVVGAGGHFAGPLGADYFYTSTGDGGAGAIDGAGGGPPALGTVPAPPGVDASSYDPGTWNGAEALAGYGGTGPLPDGGTLDDYLADAGYGGADAANAFGASGWWYVTYRSP